jgi:aminoglycoside phosphotransferase (APT) family kinase protein
VPTDVAHRALATLDELPDGDRLCHGDFHPGNVIGAPDRPVVIDWVAATRGDPDADIARTAMILRLGEPPPGASAALRGLALVGRQLLITSHLRAYTRHRPVDRTRLAEWQVVLAAHRLTVNIPGERRALLKLLGVSQAARMPG